MESSNFPIKTHQSPSRLDLYVNFDSTAHSQKSILVWQKNAVISYVPRSFKIVIGDRGNPHKREFVFENMKPNR